MPVVTVGQKGSNLYISIPKQIERFLHLHKGDTLRIEETDDQQIIIQKRDFILKELLKKSPRDAYAKFENSHSELVEEINGHPGR